MALYREREEAIKLRLQGLSYGAIREKVPVSKSTMSYWLREFPLSRERINELRAKSPARIEKFRNTMQRKRKERLEKVYQQVAKKINKMNEREIFLAGLFLY
jgi:transposase